MGSEQAKELWEKKKADSKAKRKAAKTPPKKFVRSISVSTKPLSELEELKKKIRDTENSKFYEEAIRKSEYKNSVMEGLLPAEDGTSILEDNRIYQKAEVLIEQLGNQEMSIGQLTLEMKCNILFYLAKFNKRVGRILDINTRLPISSIRLERPKHRYSIISDYVLHFYSKLFDSFGFQEMLSKIISHYWLFSFGAVLIEDDYAYLKKDSTLNGENPMENYDKLMVKEGSSSSEMTFTQEQLEEIDRRYKKSKDSVEPEMKMKFLKQILTPHAEGYRGPVKFTVLPVKATIDRLSNYDIDYHIYNVEISDNLIQLIEQAYNELKDIDEEGEEGVDFGELSKTLTEVGYSLSKVEMAFAKFQSGWEVEKEAVQVQNGVNYGTVNSTKVTFEVDTNPFNGIGMYVANFDRPGLSACDNSLFNRVIEDAVNLSLANKRLQGKTNKGYKKDIIVSVPEEVPEENIVGLDDAIQQAAQNEEGSIIVTNIQVSTSELDLNVANQVDINEIKDTSEKNITEGVGIPENLISDSTEAYSNSFLKTVLLESEYAEFRNSIRRFIEKKIFEPIAIKMGFITTNEWGEPIPLYPKIKFNRLSLARGSDDFQQILELANSSKLPYSAVLEILGFDVDEVKSELRKEATTILSDEARSALLGSLEGFSQSISDNVDMTKEIAENLDVKQENLKFDSQDAQAGMAEDNE